MCWETCSHGSEGAKGEQSPRPTRSLAQKSVAFSPGKGITDIAGVKVGHHTLKERLTGCTAILIEKGAVAGVDVRGFALPHKRNGFARSS